MILITGASGLLGANLALCAQQRGMDVVGLYHRHPLAAAGTRWLQVDLTDAPAVQEHLLKLRPQWVAHCAAMTDVDRCQQLPQEARALNTEATRNLAAAAHRVGAGMVYISTDSVFDGRAGHYSEQDATRPINVYANTKLSGEQAVQAELDRALIIRTNIYGWNAQDKQSLAEWVLARLESGEPVPGFHDVTFCPMLANDLSETVLDMIDRRLTGLYHVAGSEACSKYEFALRLGQVFGLDCSGVTPVSVEDAQLKAPRPKNTSLDTSSVSKVLGRQMPGVASGLERLKELRVSGFLERLKAMNGAESDAKF